MPGKDAHIRRTVESLTANVVCYTVDSIEQPEPPEPPNIEYHRIWMQTPSSRIETPVETGPETRAGCRGGKIRDSFRCRLGISRRRLPMSSESIMRL
jgi:hypothetical protein